MLSKKSVSIVIPNYNGIDLLEKYLPHTFQAIGKSGVDYEMIIVDDCSTDDSVRWVRSNYPQVTILVNCANLGFSLTCNRGIGAARKELVLLLNSDVALSEDYFEKLWHYFDHKETFGVMGRIVNTQGEIEDAARLLTFSGMKFKGTNFFFCEEKEKLTPTAYLSGANALVRKEMLVKLGGFDEIFSPYYCEDVDLSFRAWRLGWKCYYEHDAICQHEVSKTIRSASSKNQRLSIVYRNKFILHSIHLNGFRLILWFLQMIFIEVLFRLVVGKIWIIKSLGGFLQKRKAIIESRRNLKNLMNIENQNDSLHDVKRIHFDQVYSWRIKRV